MKEELFSFIFCPKILILTNNFYRASLHELLQLPTIIYLAMKNFELMVFALNVAKDAYQIIRFLVFFLCPPITLIEAAIQIEGVCLTDRNFFLPTSIFNLIKSSYSFLYSAVFLICIAEHERTDEQPLILNILHTWL